MVNLWFACGSPFTKTTEITKMTKTTKATQTVGSEKTNKQKTHKHFSDGPCGTIIPGTNPHPSQGQTGQNGNFTVEFNRKRPVCPRDGSQFVPGRGPVCPRDGSCLSWTPSRPKCLCLLVFCLPETATNKGLSAGIAEITETTKMTKTTGIQGASHGFPKPRA